MKVVKTFHAEKEIEKPMKRMKNISPTKIILIGYCLIILLGTVLLSLPPAVKSQGASSIFTSFFTAASATCVTGLVLTDTYGHWTIFGQAVILSMIQIGGLGFMTLCIAAVSVTKKKIGMSSRILMQNSIAAPQIGGIVRLTRFVFAAALVIELLGAVLLSFYFIPRLGVGRGIWYSMFHSISAFCNAGFDIMGYEGTYSSFTSAGDSLIVNLVIPALIVIGGLGFFVWTDLVHTRLRFSKLRCHSKIVITVSLLLLALGTITIYYFEQDSSSFAGMPKKAQLAAAFFQSASARTAGFNTIDLTAMSQAGLFLTLILMLIGGSPGSTAGGIKTTTFTALTLSIAATMKRKKSIEAFGRRMDESIIPSSACVLMSYLFLSCGTALFLAKWNNLPLLDCLFETVSAIATVGLSTGITSDLDTLSALLLVLLMIFGRIGSITILRAFASDYYYQGSELPREKIQIG